ncbi:MAG: AAA family ATPase, partial [Candidatus Tectomicrobia bacterium]|nr:AAA family ATPase [Candidatus Tectomicrobia bacterium]
GEPGMGKTQLAEAVAAVLQRAFYPFTVDARTESRDVLWRFDAIMRLAQAQLYATLHRQPAEVECELALHKFVRPGPLWWAFDTDSALAANGHDATPLEQYDNASRWKNGWVVLLDEIDKGETDLPNGLLEALGAGQFTPLGSDTPVRITGVPPLILITTNEERVLPDAFVRRCLVLHLLLPPDEADLVDYLVERGRAHFRGQTSDDVFREAARQLVGDRHVAEQAQLRPLPGQAEYLDLVRAVIELAPSDEKKQTALLAAIAPFVLRKSPEGWPASRETPR